MAELVAYVADPASVPGIGASPPSWMVEALLVDKGLAYRRVALSFEKGEHKTAAMLAKNPRGTIPVLTHGDAVVHETFAILLYLEAVAPGHLPEARAVRALALTRLFEAEHLKTAGMEALAYVMRTAPSSRDPEVLARHAAALDAELSRWEHALAGGFASGDALGLADLCVHAYTATLRQLGLSLSRWPRVEDHHDRMAALPAFASTRPPGWGAPAPRDPWWCSPADLR